MNRTLSVFLVLCVVPVLSWGEVGLQNPRLLNSVDAIMPLAVQGSRIENPKAKVRIMISETGLVTDAVCVYADDYRMVKRAESLALNYKFEPARLDGKAIAVTHGVMIHFSYDSQYHSSVDGFTNMVNFIREGSQNTNQLHLVDPRELDAPLQIVEEVKPILITNEQGEIEPGRALVEGYVNAEGEFCFLNVIEADSPYIAEAAVENFENLKFSPPRKDQKPVVCRVRIPFIATEGRNGSSRTDT